MSHNWLSSSGNGRDFSFSTTDGSATVVQLNVVVFSTTKIHPKYCRRNWGTTVLKADACADDAKCHLYRRRTIRRRKRKVLSVDWNAKDRGNIKRGWGAQWDMAGIVAQVVEHWYIKPEVIGSNLKLNTWLLHLIFLTMTRVS